MRVTKINVNFDDNSSKSFFKADRLNCVVANENTNELLGKLAEVLMKTANCS